MSLYLKIKVNDELIDPIKLLRKNDTEERNFRADLYFFRRSLEQLSSITNPDAETLERIDIRKMQIKSMFEARQLAKKQYNDYPRNYKYSGS